jgi:hypothetical protein
LREIFLEEGNLKDQKDVFVGAPNGQLIKPSNFYHS